MAQWRIDFQGRGKIETLPRARVQPLRDSIQFTLGIARQIRALGQILAQQPIRVLVGAPLPGAIRIGKEDLDRPPLRQARVFGHLFASIVRQGFAQQRRHMPEFPGEALAGTPRICAGHPGQDDQAGRPLDQRAHGRSVASPLDEVAFPVAGYGAGGYLRRARGNGRHVRDLATSVRPSRPRPTRLARLTQRGQQFASQAAAGQHIQACIDGLGREVFTHVVRIRALEPPGNLLGRTPFGQLCSDVLPQPGIQEFAWSPRLTGPRRGQRVRGARPIGAPHRVAGPLAAYGAGRSPQHPRHRPHRLATGQPQTQGFTFFSTPVSIRSCSHGNTVAHPGL